MSPGDKAVYDRLAYRDKIRYEEDCAKAYCKIPLPLKAPAQSRAGTEFDFYHKVEQSDLVPTLAALFGIPVSRNNLGVIIPELLKFWAKDKVEKGLHSDQQLLYRNALQILRILKATYGDATFDGSIDTADINIGREAETCSRMAEGADQLSCKWRLLKHTLSDKAGEVADETKTSILTDVCDVPIPR